MGYSLVKVCLGSLLKSSEAKIKVSAGLSSFLEALGMNLLPSSRLRPGNGAHGCLARSHRTCGSCLFGAPGFPCTCGLRSAGLGHTRLPEQPPVTVFPVGRNLTSLFPGTNAKLQPYFRYTGGEGSS